MIKVTVGNNVSRNTVIVEGDTTLREVLENAHIDYAGRGGIHMDGCPIGPGDLDKTFDDFGIIESTYLLQVSKADNAAR